MTRINADIDPKLLMDQHLMAEYRELPMVPAALRRSLKSKTKEQVLKSIPKNFCLGKGHVTFWYDKLDFLSKRYTKLQEELERRGYKLDKSRTSGIDGSFDCVFFNSYTMIEEDKNIIWKRLWERISEKPEWYRYSGQIL